MKRLLTLMPLLALLTAIFASSAAAQSPASATIQLIGDAETLTVGDPLTFELAVQHLDGTQAVFPQLDAQWGDFEVTGQTATEISGAEAGMVTTSQQINATAFAPGAFAPPAVSVAIYDSGGNVTEVSAESQPITINSVLIEGDTELRDIKPQASHRRHANVGVASRRRSTCGRRDCFSDLSQAQGTDTTPVATI